MLYYMHEAQRLAMAPARAAAEGVLALLSNPFVPAAYAPFAKELKSAARVFEQATRRYGKPDWELDDVVIDGRSIPVEIETLIQRTYCHLIHFKRATTREDPRLLIVAPFSGHFATLLRGTVAEMLPDHD
ncbi:MAG: polyhydroxyalkanoate depolymerase, partial [Pseudomonadota bacterium]